MMWKSQLIRMLPGLVSVVVATFAGAQDFPTKPMRVLLPYPAGTGPDIIGRSMSATMGKLLGQSIIFENKQGGGGVPAVMDMKGSPPDGYTMVLSDQGVWSILPVVQDNLPYDPLKDFAAIGGVYSNALFYVVGGNSSIKSMKDIVAQAKVKPGNLRMGVTGVGGIMHMTGEAFAHATGIKLAVVPFRATADAVASIMAGDLDVALAGNNPVVLAMLQSGKIRNIASTGPVRDRYMPDIPSVNESAGISGYNYQAEVGLVALGGTPRPVVDKLAKALSATQKDPGFLDALKKLEYAVYATTPDEFAARMRTDLEKFRAVAKAGNIKAQ